MRIKYQLRDVLRIRSFAKLLLWATRLHWTYLPWLRGKWRLYHWLSKCFERGLFEPIARFNGSLIMPVDFAEFIQRELFIFGSWEPETTSLISSVLKPGDVFIDIGANVGYFTLIGAKHVGANGSVHAFEPIPRVFSMLTRNVNINGFQNVAFNNTACWSVETELTLYEAARIDSGRSSVFAQNAQANTGSIVTRHCVRAVTVDRYVTTSGIRRVNLMKIDVEGCEIDVLNGAWGTIERDRPILIVEMVPRFLEAGGLSAQTFLDMLRRRSYQCRPLDWYPIRQGKHVLKQGWGNVLAIPVG